jgi:hypothetical protein
LGRGRTPPSSFIDAESFNKFFVDKVAKVRDATNDAPLPEFTARRPNAALRGFCRISADDVINAVRRLPDKSSVADPIPTFVLKQIVGRSPRTSSSCSIGRWKLVSSPFVSKRRISHQF